MIKKQITALVIAMSVFNLSPVYSSANEASDQYISDDSIEVNLNKFFISIEQFKELESTAINDWPNDIYAKDKEDNKEYLTKNTDNTYLMGLSDWKTIPITDQYVLLVNTVQNIFYGAHDAKILIFKDDHFEQVPIAPALWFVVTGIDSLGSWRELSPKYVIEGEKQKNYFLFDDKVERLIGQIKKYVSNSKKGELDSFETLRPLSRSESNRYKTYLSYFQPAYKSKELFELVHEGVGMTDTEISEFIYGQLLPSYSAFYKNYSNNQEFKNEMFFYETLKIYESLQKGGDKVLLDLKNKALRNAIAIQVAKQQDYTVLTDDYSQLTRAVYSRNMDSIKKALKETTDINAHYKNWTATNQAAQEGFLKELRLLVDNGADIKVRTNTKTPLLSAISGKHLNTAKYLIEQGADVNARIVTNLYSPLIYAAKDNQPEMVSLLLDNGAELWAEDYAGNSAWEWAASKKNTEVIKVFEAFNAKQGFATFDAIKAGNIRQFKKAVNKMSNIYQLNPENDNRSLLSDAADAGEVEMMQFLIDQGFNINFDAKDGVTSAYLAAKSNQLAALRLLAEQGADLQKQGFYAPIHTAAFRGHIGIMKYLLNNEYLDPLLKSKSDEGTALHSAIEGNHADVVELLLQQPAYYNALSIDKNIAGDSPLIHLFKNKHDNPRIFALLMKQSWTDIEQKDNEGKTAYDYAKEAGLDKYLGEL